MTERTFDTRPSADPRSKDWPVRPTLASVKRPKKKLWAASLVRLDQGREGACVGFGWATELMATPVRVNPPDAGPTSDDKHDGDTFALNIYRKAQTIDEWPGEDYDGTSVLAGAKVVQSIGYIDEYRWAYTSNDVVAAVTQHGPVVLGVPWYQEMYETGPYGKVNVGGPLVGGHCITLTGYDPDWRGQGEHVRWRNSWGDEYGVHGDGWLAVVDLGRLLQGDDGYGPGEACVPIGRNYGPAVIMF